MRTFGEAPPEETGLFARLKKGLAKSSAGLTDSITGLFTKKKLDAETEVKLTSEAPAPGAAPAAAPTPIEGQPRPAAFPLHQTFSRKARISGGRDGASVQFQWQHIRR